MKQSTA